MTGPGYPAVRPRRLRRTPALRRLVAETVLSVDDLVAPLFVADGIDEPRPIGSLPGVVQHTVDSCVLEVKRLSSLGVPGVILFGVPRPEDKDRDRLGCTLARTGSPPGRSPRCTPRSAIGWW